MPRCLFGMFACVTVLTSTLQAADVDILIVGSTGGNSGYVSGSGGAYDPTSIRTYLQNILQGAGVGTVNVEVENRGAPYDLAAWFHYPYPADVETTTRWPKLRGEAGKDWDYVIVIGDLGTMETMPGLYAHGVAMVAQEVAKGGAETVLLMPWSKNASKPVAHYQEVVYRAGRSGPYKVAPAALAWQAAGSPNNGTAHPTADGAFIAAASIYSTIWNQSATASTYVYNDTLANTVHTSVTTNNSAVQYTGNFSFQNPFLMIGDKRRDIYFSEKGTSTEQDFKSSVNSAMARARVNYSSTHSDKYSSNTPEDDGRGWPTNIAVPIAWNHGRKFSETAKEYVTNPAYWQLGMGYKYQHNTWASTVASANDTHIGQIAGEDLSLANYMGGANDMANGRHSTARCIPWRLIWAQIHQYNSSLNPLRDGSGPHLNNDLHKAVGTYMYTLYSGRCPLDPQPNPITTTWIANRIGYETAWRLGSCQSRAPGFKVMPSAASKTSIAGGTTETMTVQFILPPKSNVTVNISSSNSSAATVSPSTLTFTPANYSIPQSITVTALSGLASNMDFDVVYSTVSTDEAYNNLSDSWRYTALANLPTVSWSVASQSSASESGTLSVTAQLSGASTSPVTVPFTVSGTATNGVDYTITSSLITIPAGSTTGSAMISIIQDSIREIGSETVILTMGTPTYATLGANVVHTATITDDDNTAPIVSAGTAQTVFLTQGNPVPWTPAHMGTAAWYDAADAGKVQTSGSAVTSLLDKSGNNLHLSQSNTALQPVTGAAINGLNAVNFTGDIMTTASNPFGATVSNAFVISVHKVDAVADGTFFTLSGAANRWQAHVPWSDGKLYFDCGGTASPNRLSATYGVSAGSVAMTSFYGSTTHNVQQVYNNGALLVSDSSGHAVNTVGNITVGGVSTSYQDTTLGEFIIINGTVDVATREMLEGYLAHKWGLTANLPVGHPYKAAAPTVDGDSAVANLSGSASDPDNDPLTTSWTVLSKPAGSGVTFSNASALNPTVTFSAAGDYILRLTANDGTISVNNDTTITVIVQSGGAPVVNAGSDQSVALSDTTSTPWTPVQMSTAAWYDGADLATITQSGGLISQWNDKSSNNRHVSQATSARRPTYSGSSVNFDGTDDILFRTGAFMYANGSVDIYVAGAFSPSSADKRFIAESNSGSNNSLYCPFQNRSATDLTMMSAFIRDDGGGGRFSNSSSLSAAGAFNLTTRKLYQVRDTGSSMAGRVNGGSATTVNYTRASTTLTSFGIGGIPPRPSSSSGSAWMRGDVNEIVIVPSLLDDASRQKLEGYLAHKWGMTANLPAGHPYINAAPTTGATLADATLAGSASDPDNDPLTISWTVLTKPIGSTVTFSNASSPNSTATFSALGSYTLRLTANDGTTPISDDVVISVEEAQATAYQQWLAEAGLGEGEQSAFDADANRDGIANGMGWLLGADNANDNAHEFLPQSSESGGDLSLSFKILNAAQRGSAVLYLQYSSDLGITDPWINHTIPVPDVSGAVNGVEFEITPIDGTDHNHVEVIIPASAAGGGGKVFARLQGMLEP